jgi:hypothetical protein
LIADLEAINVVDETVWTSYDTQYPVARVENDDVTIWPTAGGQVASLLVDRDRIALIGDRAVLGRLDAQRFLPTGSTTLMLPASRWSAEPPSVIGQGAVLHVIMPDGRWSVTDLDALEAGQVR